MRVSGSELPIYSRLNPGIYAKIKVLFLNKITILFQEVVVDRQNAKRWDMRNDDDDRSHHY